MIIAVPEAIFSNVYTFRDPNKNTTFESCTSYPASKRLVQEIHSLLCFLVFYMIPLSVISVYYSLIARALYKSTLHMPIEEHKHAHRQVCVNQDSCMNLEVKGPSLAPVNNKYNNTVVLLLWSWALESVRARI